MEYSKNVSVKTLFIAAKRNFVTIIYFFLVFLLLGVGYANFVSEKIYQSSGQIAKENGYFNAAEANNFITENLQSTNFCEILATKVLENGLRHSNGNPITTSEIKSNLKLPAAGEKSIYEISFSNSDKLIIKGTLDVILNESVTLLKEKYPANFGKIYVSMNASTPVKVSNENKYYIAFSVVGLGLGYIVSFTKEMVYDSIDSINDVKLLADRAFNIEYSNKRGGKKND